MSSKQSIFFGLNRNKPKLNLFWSFFGLFRETKKHFFRFVLVFGPIKKQPKQTEFCRNKLKQTKKISKKRSLLGGPRNREFFSQVEPKQTETQSVSIVFRFAFSRNQQFLFSVCFCLFQCFGPVSKQPKQTELIVWGIKKVDILTNLLLFWLVFGLFWLFQNTKTLCFGVKAKQPKQMSCFG